MLSILRAAQVWGGVGNAVPGLRAALGLKDGADLRAVDETEARARALVEAMEAADWDPTVATTLHDAPEVHQVLRFAAEQVVPRLAGTTAEPQQFSVAFLTGLMLMLSRRYIRFCWPLALAGVLALLLSQSKFALVSLVAVVFYIDTIYKQHRLVFGALAVLLLVPGVAFITSLPVFSTTIRQGFAAQTFTDRVENLGIMLSIIEDEPLDGIGVGQYGTYRGALVFNNPLENPNYAAGNDIISIFAETGVFGFALVAFLFTVLFSKFLGVVGRLTRGRRERYLPALIGALTIFLNMFIGYEFLHAFFWINLGVLLYLYREWGFVSVNRSAQPVQPGLERPGLEQPGLEQPGQQAEPL